MAVFDQRAWLFWASVHNDGLDANKSQYTKQVRSLYDITRKMRRTRMFNHSNGQSRAEHVNVSGPTSTISDWRVESWRN